MEELYKDVIKRLQRNLTLSFVANGAQTLAILALILLLLKR